MLKDDDKLHKTVKPGKGSPEKVSFLKLLLNQECHNKPRERLFLRELKGGALLLLHI